MFDLDSKYIATLPYFFLYFAVSLAIVGIFIVVYTAMTRHSEWRLIREGNTAAAITLVGAILGFVLPLAITITASVNIADMIMWGVIAMVVQLVAYFVVRRALPQFDDAINAGRAAPATLLAGLAVCIGILNAACITY
jgi:putative membrane protein